MTNFSSGSNLATQFYQIDLVRRIDRWLYAMPQPSFVVEIAGDHVASARYGSTRGSLDAFAVEPLPTGSVMPSPIENNITQPDTVRAALRKVFNSVPANGESLTLLVPDSVVRIFILAFDFLPRKKEEALPLLRWRLKKSVPFDVEETIVSWMRQNSRDNNLEVITAVARQAILREYEQLIESLGGRPDIVVSSTLAVLPLLEESGATLLVRLCGKALTTAITFGPNLCVYRSSEMPSGAALLDPQAMLDEVFPAVAYYQDNFDSSVDRVRISGFGSRQDVFQDALVQEMRVPVGALTESAGTYDLSKPAKDLIPRGLDALAGWTMNAEP